MWDINRVPPSYVPWGQEQWRLNWQLGVMDSSGSKNRRGQIKLELSCGSSKYVNNTKVLIENRELVMAYESSIATTEVVVMNIMCHIILHFVAIRPGQHGEGHPGAMHCHGPLARYVKLWVAHAPGMPGTFSLPPRVSDPVMHYGTYVAHMLWCMPG